MKFDLQRLSQLDRVIAGAAIVVFIAGLLPWRVTAGRRRSTARR